MAHHKKKHGPAPVPPGNRPQTGPQADMDLNLGRKTGTGGGAPFEDQDAKRRLGGFESAGEHSRQQPGAINDGDKHSK